MSDKQQPHHRPQATGPLADVKGIAVHDLHFKETLDIPGRLSSQGVRNEADVEGARNRKRWRITYLPALRHMQLDFFLAGSDKAETFFVHESRVEWWSPKE